MQLCDSEGGASLTPGISAMLRAANHDWHKYLTINLYEEEVRRFSTEANTGEPRHASKKDWPPWCALISVNNFVKTIEQGQRTAVFPPRQFVAFLRFCNPVCRKEANVVPITKYCDIPTTASGLGLV